MVKRFHVRSKDKIVFLIGMLAESGELSARSCMKRVRRHVLEVPGAQTSCIS